MELRFSLLAMLLAFEREPERDEKCLYYFALSARRATIVA